MRKSITVVFLILNLIFITFCSAQIKEGEFSIGGVYYDYGNSIIQTKEGGFAIAGYTNSYSAANYDIYVVKLSLDGNLKWTRVIGGTGPSLNDEASSIVQTRDGGLAVTGYTMTYALTWANVYVIKLDSLGNVKWTNRIYNSGFDYGRSIIQTRDGGLAIAGITLSGSYYHVYVMKLDSIGNLKWAKNIGGSNTDYGNSIVQTYDKGYAIAGYTLSYGAGGQDVYVIKLDSLGNLQWTKTIGGSGDDEGNSIVQTKDKGYAIAGITNSYGAGNYDVYAIKLDSLGNLKWTRTIGGANDDEGNSIIETQDKGYSIAGFTNSYGAGLHDVYVIKLDSLGNLIWTKTMGGPDDEEGNSIIQTKDKGLAITGWDEDYATYYNADVYLIKLDSGGNSCAAINTGGIVDSGGTVSSGGSITVSGGVVKSVTSGIDSIGSLNDVCGVITSLKKGETSSDIVVYPNPSNGIFIIKMKGNEQGNKCSLNIYNIYGQMIYASIIEPAKTQTSSRIDLNNQQNGVYFYRILNEENSLLGEGKIIKEQ